MWPALDPPSLLPSYIYHGCQGSLLFFAAASEGLETKHVAIKNKFEVRHAATKVYRGSEECLQDYSPDAEIK